MNGLLVMPKWLAAGYLSKQIELAHYAQNGFDADFSAMLSFQPSANTAAAAGLFAALLAVDDQINELLILGGLPCRFRQA